MQILIIDNDSEDIELLQEALLIVHPFIKFLSARDGLDGFKTLQTISPKLPDYIFLDLNMPVMGGKDFLNLAKKELTLHKVPIVIYSTSNHTKDVKECFNLGAKFYLVKATRTEDLVGDLRKIIFPESLLGLN
jgi:CheY-like chemotaxis protein